MDRPATAEELFDAIGSAYEDAFGRPPVIGKAVRHLLDVLPSSSRVLDIGSGTGRPVAEDLATAGHRVTGLDVSSVMVEVVPRDEENAPVEFFGRTIHMTSFAPEDLVRRVEAAGLAVTGTHAEIFTADEPGTPPEKHLLINARRPV
ncbi:class I SAM-dependent methyltransferase [Amycolatopsis sp. lyj-112]|uniref:class I SAM-dependent methyltransferase n=1 Tax=Amycolatopsis sp. lyj-112 TaxID=2789288 RepID=UPI0039790EAF